MKKYWTVFCSAFLLVTVVTAQVPEGYYDNAEGLTGEALKSELHKIIDDHDEYSYDDLRDFILKNTDEDPENPDNVILLYSGRSQAKSTFGGYADNWNREHVWAKSHGNFGNNPPEGTDAHHIRPTDVSVNSSRGNLDFDNGGHQHGEAEECYYDNDSWEPRDAVKGDVARMLFYMAVRYEGGSGEEDLELVDRVNTGSAPEHGKLSVLLEWHEQDPPDDFETNRNEVIYGYQGNRNPFIDHPEYADYIWDKTAGIDREVSHTLSSWPNPAKSELTVELPEQYDPEYEPGIYSIIGQKYKLPVRSSGNQAVFNVSELPSGYYAIRLYNGRAKDYIVRFIKK